jgi:hypothetical protein
MSSYDAKGTRTPLPINQSSLATQIHEIPIFSWIIVNLVPGLLDACPSAVCRSAQFMTERSKMTEPLPPQEVWFKDDFPILSLGMTKTELQTGLAQATQTDKRTAGVWLAQPETAKIIRFLPDLQNYYQWIESTPKHMDKIVPLIGSAEVGPLGVLHLPRLWLKVSLDAKGALANGYPAVGTGFDQMVLDGLSLKKDAVVEFITKNRPTYCQFEAWIKEQPGTHLDSTSITKLNDAIRGYNHDEGTVQSVLGENALPSDIGIRDAVTLNRIDDWKCFHEAVLK